MSDWFEINVGTRQGCVMSLCLLNVFCKMGHYVDTIVKRGDCGVAADHGRTQWKLQQLFHIDVADVNLSE